MAAEKVRIADLANPVLSDLQRQTLAHTAANPVTLTPEAIMAAAQAATGLDHWGDDAFRPRLAAMTQAIADDTGLSSAGRASLFGLLLRCATQRLHVENAIRRHPEIEDIALPRPLLIAGLPRSGTTYTLQLMAADARLRSLPHWEGIRPWAEPYIAAGEDTRLRLATEEYRSADAVMPYGKLIHDFDPEHITEDIELTNMDFGGYYLEWLARVPGWRDYQFAHDRTGPLHYMRRALQLLTFQKGPDRWVIKCPQHMEQLVEVNTVFPDAFTVVTHRDPVASIQSAITGMAYSSRLTRTSVNLDEIAEYWIDRYERLLRACVRDRDALDPDRAHDLYFHELMADPFGELEAIYAGAGVPFDDQTRADFDRAIAANQRGKHGQLVYDLRGDFGLDPEAVRERFGFYFDRFPQVRIEVR